MSRSRFWSTLAVQNFGWANSKARALLLARREFFFVKGEPDLDTELSTSYEPLVDELSVGDQVMLADGTVSMVVEEASARQAHLRVVQQGTIRSRQGINLARRASQCAGHQLSTITSTPSGRPRQASTSSA